MKKEKNLIICDIKNRHLIIDSNIIHLPPGQFIIYLHYLTNKTSECNYPAKTPCNDCHECFALLSQTVKSTDNFLSLYKQIYSEHSAQYQRFKKNCNKRQTLPYKYLLQKISKINHQIKVYLKKQTCSFIISANGKYGRKVYGITVDRNKITILDREELS